MKARLVKRAYRFSPKGRKRFTRDIKKGNKIIVRSVTLSRGKKLLKIHNKK